MKRYLLLVLPLALLLGSFSSVFADPANGIQFMIPEGDPPLAPLPVTPQNDEQIFDQHYLSWVMPDGSPEATEYEVYIDGVSMFGPQNWEEYHMLWNVSLGTHSWYVVARNEYGESAPSVARTFELVDPTIVGTSQWSSTIYPFNSFYGYGRSLGLYTADQIGQTGLIDGLGWHAGVSGPAYIPYKIYVKTTTDTALTPMTWNAFTSSATLVKEGYHSFSQWPFGWQTFRLDTPFHYTGENLLIGVESNFGDYGSGHSNCPYFYFTPGSHGIHQYWEQNGSAPTGVGNLNANLPNLAIIFSPFEVDVTISSSNIVLQWEPIPGVSSYKVYASDDPYNFGTDPIATVNTNSYTTPATEPRRFFRVTGAFGE